MTLFRSQTGFMTRLCEGAGDRLDFLCRRMHVPTIGLLCELRRKSEMHHFFASDDKYRDPIYDDDYCSHRINKRNLPSDYRFGRTHGKRVWVHGRAALSRVNGYLKSMIEEMANSKLRRMERELELHGIRRDRLNGNPVALKFRLTELSRESK